MDITGRTIRLRLAQVEDAEMILGFRLDNSRNQHLSPVDADVEKQAAWLRSYKDREAARQEFYFVIETAGDPVGLVRLYDFQGPSFCWGSWIIRPGAPTSAAIESALLVYETAFGVLGFKAAHFDVRQQNRRVWSFHERMGATLVGADALDRYYTYSLQAYLTIRPKYRRFLPADFSATTPSL